MPAGVSVRQRTQRSFSKEGFVVALAGAVSLKHEPVINCHQIIRLEKTMLTEYIGALSLAKLKQLRSALVVAFDVDDEPSRTRRSNRWPGIYGQLTEFAGKLRLIMVGPPGN
jgi:hypothetical protein